MDTLPVPRKADNKFNPLDLFPSNFQRDINTLLDAALKEAKYQGYVSSSFNMKEFDIEINGKKKSALNGSGYCSYLNTILALCLHQYMFSYAQYKPGFVIIDTPLLGLDQGDSRALPDSMKTALFQYMISHKDQGQIVVIENLNNIPSLDYIATGANVITFTGEKGVGRYGFLLNEE